MVRHFKKGGYAAEGGGAAGKGAGKGKGSEEEAPSVNVKGLGRKGSGSVPQAEAAPAGDLSRMSFKGTSDYYEIGDALKLYIPVQYQKGDDRRFYAAWIPS